MDKIIGIFAIVFVYYCEINAEIDYSQHKKTTTVDVRRIVSKKKHAGNKSDDLLIRSNVARSHAKFTTGFREDIRGPHNEYVLMNGEARYNDLEHHVVKKRRFKRKDRDEENNEIENDSKKPKKKKRQHHDSERKMNKKHNSTNDTEEKDDEDKHKKHRHHLGRKMNMINNSTINKKTKRYKNVIKNKKHHYRSGRNMDRNNDSTRNKKTKRHKNRKNDKNIDKDQERNKEKNHSGKRNRVKKHSNYLENPKKEKDDIHKKEQVKDKSKDKLRDKSIDRNKHATTEGPVGVSIDAMMRLAGENDHKKNKKQLINNSNEKQKEKSKHTMDTIKTAIGMAGLGAGVLSLVEKSGASIKDPKLHPEHVQTLSTTPKPPPDEEEEEVVREKKLLKRERLKLRTQEIIRMTKMVPFAMNKQEDEGPERKQKSGGEGGGGSPPSYLSPYAITAQMELLMKEFPNVNATISKAGRTVEYNDIVLVRITEKKEDETYFRVKESKYIDDVPEKKIIFIVHGLSVMGMKDMTTLVKSSELKILLSYYFKHLDKFDIFLIPLANPDGYTASLSPDRAIWNKNVSPQSVCSGVFVDRNFDVAWNYSKQISSCSQLYPGDAPFSEEESKAVRDVFHHYSHKILAYIHVHAGTFDDKVFKGDAILYPRGYTETQSDDDKYIDIKGEVDEAMKNASFRVMTATVDTLSNWYGVVTGTSVDYAATVYGIPYAMEFVMQLYDSESLTNDALTEIWSRLIDASFNNMWKNLQAGNDARRSGVKT